jgi:hypothetical protein
MWIKFCKTWFKRSAEENRSGNERTLKHGRREKEKHYHRAKKSKEQRDSDFLLSSAAATLHAATIFQRRVWSNFRYPLRARPHTRTQIYPAGKYRVQVTDNQCSFHKGSAFKSHPSIRMIKVQHTNSISTGGARYVTLDNKIKCLSLALFFFLFFWQPHQ